MTNHISASDLQEKLKTELEAVHVEIEDKTDPHCKGGKYVAIIVSEKFQGKSLVQRHRLVNGCLEEELKEKIHALSMKTLTPEQWQKQQSS
ncbi:bolA-like protein 2 [Glandiceps talaboti]